MAVRIAQAARKGMNMPRYQAQSPGPLREQEGLWDMARPYVANAAAKKAEEKAMPMIEEGFLLRQKSYIAFPLSGQIVREIDQPAD